MPFGLAVWEIIAALAVIVGAASLWVKSEWSARVCLIICAAYIFMQIQKVIPIHGGDIPINSEYFNEVSCGIWVIAAGYIYTDLKRRELYKYLTFRAVPALISVVGLCYYWAEVTDAPLVMWSPPYTASDLCALFAVLLIGWTLRHDIISRIRDMGRRRNNGSVYSFRPSSGFYDSQVSRKAVTPPEVRRDGRG